MKIAIDLRRMTDFGVGTYIRNVVRTLSRLDRNDTFLLIGPQDRIKEIGPLPGHFHGVPLPGSERSLQGYREFRTAVKRLDCDLVHIPNLFSVPRALSCPYVMTVHDLLEHMSRARGQTGFWQSLHFRLTQRVLAGANKILAVSNFTKYEIVKLFGIPADKIEVVHNAIDERFFHGHASASDREMIAQRYQVNYPFLLYVGRVSPHKNVLRMIEAFSVLKAELKKDDLFPGLKFIIIGDDLASNPGLRTAVIKTGMKNDVRFLGFVPIEVLRIFYDSAKVFVFPSLYEGFGLPPLEAMAHGTPVVTSNVTSLPEVVGNAAVRVNPENVFEIMHALRRVLTDPQLREQMKQRGYQQAARFSWDKSVGKILGIYGEALRPVNQSSREAASESLATPEAK